MKVADRVKTELEISPVLAMQLRISIPYSGIVVRSVTFFKRTSETEELGFTKVDGVKIACIRDVSDINNPSDWSVDVYETRKINNIK